MRTQTSLGLLLVLGLVLPAGTLMIAGRAFGAADAKNRPQGPCDIYASEGTPCVAAHSTTRALSAGYNGPLYQVMRQSDGRTLDIGVVKPSGEDPGGYADAAAQDAFCEGSLCWITVIYDQSGKGNHLRQAPPGTFKGPARGAFNTLPIADMAPVLINGHKAYGAFIMPGMGLRNNDATGLAVNDDPEGIYYVIDGTHYDSGCCFDYGNSSANGRAVGTGTMETVYFGTATAWGSGDGPGPWIMADFEAGLFTGYNAKKNTGSPTIDSWRFVTAVVNGGGGNKWDLRGGNAQEGGLKTFYTGIRPGSSNNAAYFPMNKKGGILLGNGGDNGNGSSGTFYEGVMTAGYPTDSAIEKVQANIVAARYDVFPVSLSRLLTFTPGSSQDVTVTFTNSTRSSVPGVKLSVSVPDGWTVRAAGGTGNSKVFGGPVSSGSAVSAVFNITPPPTAAAGYLTGRAEWRGQDGGQRMETMSRRLRNALPVKINEVRLGNGANASDQFVELYNASDRAADISGWTLVSTRSQWAPANLAVIPPGTTLAPRGFHLLGLASSGLAAPAHSGDGIINVRSVAGFEPGQQVNIDGETRAVVRVGTAAAAMTTLFIPVSTGPWLAFSPGTTNLPVAGASGFEVGQKIGIGSGADFEVATVTEAGKAGTQTSLLDDVKAGDSRIRVAANSNVSVGDTLTVGTGGLKETVAVKSILSVSAAPAGGEGSGGGARANRGGTVTGGTVELAGPLAFDHQAGVDVSCVGTGIRFSPATKFPHKSGDAIQALGSGVTLDAPLGRSHAQGAPIINLLAKGAGYQGSAAPDQWFGDALSSSAGSIALMDASGRVVVDGMVYGSQQSSSSANGTITSPEIATLEGDQRQGGCIVVVPASGRGGFGRRGVFAAGENNKSLGRFPDGADTDSNCDDFFTQTAPALSMAAAAGANNLKVASVAEFRAGQTILIDTGTNRESAVIAKVGTPGGTTSSAGIEAGATLIPVGSPAGFAPGQAITIDAGGNAETAVVASVIGGGRTGPAGASLRVDAPLKSAHPAGSPISGSGITLSSPLIREHKAGIQIIGNIPTPGAPNQYARRTP